jgi:DNA-binding winged helix-turn-helix (wHTH) protein/Flp pilus assembly protein TadD
MMKDSFRIEGWLVEVKLGRLSRGSQIIRLEPQVMKVLAYLASRPGEVVSKDELLAELWNRSTASDAALARCISRIRVAFGDDARQSRIIENIPKIGYRLVADLQSDALDAASGNKRRWLTVTAAGLVLAVVVASQIVIPGDWDALAARDQDAVQSYYKGRDQYARYTYPFNQNAIMHFEQALEIDPDFGLAHAGLADALVQEAHYWNGDRAALALQHAERAVELEPAHIESARALGKALALNGYEERALDAFEQALRIDPDDWASALQSANLYFQRLDFNNAESAYLAALRSAPNLDVAMSNLGYLYLKSGDTEAARQWFDRALELFPLQQQAAPRLAMLEMLTGHPDQADSLCERLVESYPKNYGCLQLLAVTGLAKGDLERALHGFIRVLEAFPDDRYARLGKAKILLAQNRRSEATGLVEDVLAMTEAKIASGEPEAYDYWLVAGGHAVLGNSADAYEWFDKAAEAGRRFFLWDEADPLFEDLRSDSRFDHYIAATMPDLSSRNTRASVD